MSRTISVGQLGQDPATILREVASGAVYTVTDHGEPIAEITPTRQHRWVQSEEVDALLRELGSDDAWNGDLTEGAA